MDDGSRTRAVLQKRSESEGNCDRLQHYEVRFPSQCAGIKAVFTPPALRGPDGPLHKDTFAADSANFMTPTRILTEHAWLLVPKQA
jgi:hypothetical protein